MSVLKSGFTHKSLFNSSRPSLFSLKNHQKHSVVLEPIFGDPSTQSSLIEAASLETDSIDLECVKVGLQSRNEYSKKKHKSFNMEFGNKLKRSRMSLRAINRNSYFAGSFSKLVANRNIIEPITNKNIINLIQSENTLDEKNVIKDELLCSARKKDDNSFLQMTNIQLDTNDYINNNNNYSSEVKTNFNFPFNNGTIFENIDSCTLKYRKRSSSLSDVKLAKHVIETKKIRLSDNKCSRLSDTNSLSNDLSICTLLEHPSLQLITSTKTLTDETMKVVPRKNGVTYHVDLNDFKNSQEYLHRNAKQLNNALQFSEVSNYNTMNITNSLENFNSR